MYETIITSICKMLALVKKPYQGRKDKCGAFKNSTNCFTYLLMLKFFVLLKTSTQGLWKIDCFMLAKSIHYKHKSVVQKYLRQNWELGFTRNML